MLKKLVSSFKFALEGIFYCIRTQRNFKIHLCTAFVAVVLAWWRQIPNDKILFLILVIALVLIAELFNTAIETVVDMISPTFNPLAKIAKDVAAGAVLLAAAASLAIGYFIFFV